MSKKVNSPLALAVGSALIGSLSLGQVAHASDAFKMNLLASGYMADDHGTDKAKEGKCGADKKAHQEGKCGGEHCEHHKAKEGKCGGEKCEHDKAGHEGKCGEKMKKAHEGKCGEGKCGADKKAKEGKCGSEKKAN